MVLVSSAPHPATGLPERKASNAYFSHRARQFSKYDFPRRRGWLKCSSLANNLPGGAPERIKRGKEKFVTRAVANAEMKSSGISERGNTALSELNELNKKSILMVQQFLKIILWRV